MRGWRIFLIQVREKLNMYFMKWVAGTCFQSTRSAATELIHSCYRKGPTSRCSDVYSPRTHMRGESSLCVRVSICQAKCTHLDPPPPSRCYVLGTSLALLWRWTPMETGFLSLIPCDLLFIKIKLCVRKHNLFLPWCGCCSTSPLSCISACLCLPCAVCQASTAHSWRLHLRQGVTPKKHFFMIIYLNVLKKRCE